MFLGVKSDNEGWDINDLLADARTWVSRVKGAISKCGTPNMALPDQYTCMVDTLG